MSKNGKAKTGRCFVGQYATAGTRRSMSRVLGYKVNGDNFADAMADLRSRADAVRTKSAKARAWSKLAPILAAIGSLACALEDFRMDPDAAPMADGATGDLLAEFQDVLWEQGGMIAGAAARVVAG